MGAMNAAADLPADAGQGLSTRRLVLRRFTPQDLPWLSALYADPRVASQIGGVRSAEDTRILLEQRMLAYYEANPGLGVWMTCLRSSGEPVGMHLLNHIQGEALIQVGYALPAAHWNQGYATEMAVAVMRYGYERLGLTQIVAIANLDNLGSHKVLLKTGLERRADRSFPHPAYAKQGPLAYFESERAAWLARKLPQ
jgi:RimJ/RimL family protein N-acetyltransferase